jgi:uncharacterized OB-fold protein
MTAPILPVDFDRDTGPFFRAAREKKLVYLRCADCQRGTHPPMPACKHCGSINVSWQEAHGGGTLFSWTIVAQQVHPAYPAPYAIVVVALDAAPDVRLIGRTEPRNDFHAGQPMRRIFRRMTDSVIMPDWEPAEP